MGRRKTKHFKDFSQINKEVNDKNINDTDWKETQEKLVLSQIIKPRTKNQERVINSILTNVFTFIIGPAGTGKTTLSCGIASKLLYEGKIEKIIITRPQVEVGGIKQGYLPGDHKEKLMPYLIPIIDAFKDFLGNKEVDRLIKDEIIEIVPLGLIRGRSPKKTMIIADECQSCRYMELKTLITRIDVNSSLVILADPEQSDLEEGAEALKLMMKKLWVLRDEIGFVYLTADDCQRAGLVKKILALI